MIKKLSKNFIIVYRDESIDDKSLNDNFMMNNHILKYISDSTLKITNNYNNLLNDLEHVQQFFPKKSIETVRLDPSFGIGHKIDIVGDIKLDKVKKAINNKDKIYNILEIENNEENSNIKDDLLKFSINSVINKEIDIVNVINNVDISNRNNILSYLYRLNIIITKMRFILLLNNVDNMNKLINLKDSERKKLASINSELDIILNNLKISSSVNVIKHIDNDIEKKYKNVPLTSKLNIILDNYIKQIKEIFDTKEDNNIISDTILDSIKEFKNNNNISKPLEIICSYNKKPKNKLDCNIEFKPKKVENISDNEMDQLIDYFKDYVILSGIKNNNINNYKKLNKEEIKMVIKQNRKSFEEILITEDFHKLNKKLKEKNFDKSYIDLFNAAAKEENEEEKDGSPKKENKKKKIKYHK